jgi:hypothetical protein
MLFFAACTEIEKPVDELVDLRADLGEAPEDGFQVQTPEWIVEPYTDIITCYFGSYTGPDAGLYYYEWFQNPAFGHHLMLLAVPDDFAAEDGAFIDCTDSQQSMMNMPPLLQGTEATDPPNGRMELPEGTAVLLKSGQKWAIQSHYTNTSADSLLVQDALNIRLLPEADVQQWAATYVVNTSHFELPSGRYALDVRCVWPQDAELLTMMGHMHENGRSISIYHENTSSRLIYEVDPWEASMVNSPILQSFAPGEQPLQAGDQLYVHCEFDNLTGAPLTFPSEMCVGAGMAVPMSEPWQCDPEVNAVPW